MSQAQSFVWDRAALRKAPARAVETDPPDDVPPILVSDSSPTAAQRRLALGIVFFLAAAFAVATPFYSLDLPVVAAFVPVVHAVVCITGLIAAAFLFSQYAVLPQPAFLVLASGYLLAGLFAFFQSLAFPNAYSPAGVLGGGPSVAAWLFVLWRTSFPLAILAYVLTRRPATAGAPNRPVALPIAMTVGCTAIAACLLTWMATIARSQLPALFTDAHHEASNVHYVMIPAIVLSLAAILLLLTRRRTTLDLWLIVTLVAALPDVAVPVTRYALGFYLARGYELISSCAVLIALLTESSTLYARLAIARILQAHGEGERLRSVESATAAIAHELRQPLSAIRIHAQAGARLLAGANPSLTDISDFLGDIEKDACRANDVIDRIRAIIRQQKLSKETLDINAVVSDAVRLVSDDAAAQAVGVVINPASERVQVAGDRTQITQVLLNLMANGMEAMEAAPDAERWLTLDVRKRDGMAVISVSDRGRGIAPENMPRIFDPFFTTRRGGIGLGLSISQSIAIAHNGRLWAENGADGGATFYFSLPISLEA